MRDCDTGTRDECMFATEQTSLVLLRLPVYPSSASDARHPTNHPCRRRPYFFFFFLNDPPPPNLSPLPQHDPLPIYPARPRCKGTPRKPGGAPFLPGVVSALPRFPGFFGKNL